MKKIHPIWFGVVGLVLVYIGNAFAGPGQVVSGITDIIATGIGLFGDFLIFYALYLGVRWLTAKKAVEKKPPAPPSPQKPS